jgi:hypothetical protein
MAASSRIRRSATASAARRRNIASVFLPSCATAAPASGLTVPSMIWPPESITAVSRTLAVYNSHATLRRDSNSRCSQVAALDSHLKPLRDCGE